MHSKHVTGLCSSRGVSSASIISKHNAHSVGNSRWPPVNARTASRKVPRIPRALSAPSTPPTRLSCAFASSNSKPISISRSCAPDAPRRKETSASSYRATPAATLVAMFGPSIAFAVASLPSISSLSSIRKSAAPTFASAAISPRLASRNARVEPWCAANVSACSALVIVPAPGGWFPVGEVGGPSDATSPPLNALSAISVESKSALASSTRLRRSCSAASANSAAPKPSPIFCATPARFWQTDASAAKSLASRAMPMACAYHSLARSKSGGVFDESNVPSATKAPISAPGGSGLASFLPSFATARHIFKHRSAGSNARIRIIPCPAIRNASHSTSRPNPCLSCNSFASMAMSCRSETAGPVPPRQNCAVAAPSLARRLLKWRFALESVSDAEAVCMWSSSASGAS
mmetsp:Transcript_5473/g.20668  ORF Transcript_5473/g.20668 Transcript_5473/m.20668 type:complete len:406 (-) Transcript_5473:892-2109(-)